MASVKYSFSKDNKYFIYSSLDSISRIWDVDNGNNVAELSNSKHLTATCTCVKWDPGRRIKKSVASSPNPKKRRSKAEAANDLDLIAMGLANGTILLYSFSRSEVHTNLVKGHADRVTSLCWHPSVSTTLYSSSLDGYVCEWDIASSKVRQKWKAAVGGVHAICLCSSKRLATADHSIKLWDIESKTLIQKFTGHSSEVMKLLPVIYPCQDRCDVDDDGATSCHYMISAAANDRVLSLWQCNPEEMVKKAITSFSMSEEPADFCLNVSANKMVTLAVLSAQGQVHVFQHVLNGMLSKPLTARTVIQAVTAGSRDEPSKPVSLLAVTPSVQCDSSLLVVYGSNIKPVFQTVALQPEQPRITLVMACSKKSSTGEHAAQLKVPEISQGHVLNPNDVVPHIPGEKGGKLCRKRKKSASELTLEDRLIATGQLDGPSQSESSSVRPPRADQLVVQLTQGLQSDDHCMLNNTFQESNQNTICNTVKRLPLQHLSALVKELARRLTFHPNSGCLILRWVKQILMTHSSYLVTIPDVLDCLKQISVIMEHSVVNLSEHIRQQGRLEMILSRCKAEAKTQEDSSSIAEAMFVYQDVSSDDDVPNQREGADFDSDEDKWDDSE